MYEPCVLRLTGTGLASVCCTINPLMITALLTLEYLAHLLNCEKLSLLSIVVRHMAVEPSPKDNSEALLLFSTPFGSCLAGLHTAFCISLDHMLLYL